MNDKKEKRLMNIVASVILGLIALILIVMFCILRSVQNYIEQNYVSNHEYIKMSEIKTYVEENCDELTEIAERLIDEQEDEIAIDREQEDFIQLLDSHISEELDISRITIEKQSGDNDRNDVYFVLNNKPSDDLYRVCGIYYSQSDLLMDSYGNYRSEDEYVFDGRPEDIRCVYRSEKICDGWYYYEEHLW